MSMGPGTCRQTIFHDYSGTTVGTSNWVQLDSALNSTTGFAEIFDSSGQLMELGQGPSGSESRIAFIMPGGNGHVPLFLPQGMRLAVRAVDASAATGFLAVNLWG